MWIDLKFWLVFILYIWRKSFMSQSACLNPKWTDELMFVGKVKSVSLKLCSLAWLSLTRMHEMSPPSVCDAFMQTVFLYFISVGIVWDVHGALSISTLLHSRFIALFVTDGLEYWWGRIQKNMFTDQDAATSPVYLYSFESIMIFQVWQKQQNRDVIRKYLIVVLQILVSSSGGL